MAGLVSRRAAYRMDFPMTGSSPDIEQEMTSLLRRARQFVADAGSDEDDMEVNVARTELLGEIDAALSGGVAQPMPTREQIARTLAQHLWCGATYDDATEAEKDAFVNAADAVLALTSTDPATCEHRITVTPRNGAPHGAGFACGLSGGHCLPKEGCGYSAMPSPQRESGK